MCSGVFTGGITVLGGNPESRQKGVVCDVRSEWGSLEESAFPARKYVSAREWGPTQAACVSAHSRPAAQSVTRACVVTPV